MIAGDQGGAGLFKNNGVYRTMFWAFPFEVLPNPEVRADAMRRILDSLGQGPSIFADGFESGDVTAWGP